MSVENLTIMQAAVICGWAEGMTEEDIAFYLGIKPTTVHTHGYRIRRKLGVHTQAGAVGMWERYRRRTKITPAIMVPGEYDSDDLDRLVR